MGSRIKTLRFTYINGVGTTDRSLSLWQDTAKSAKDRHSADVYSGTYQLLILSSDHISELVLPLALGVDD